jgi:hypothetical protein
MRVLLPVSTVVAAFFMALAAAPAWAEEGQEAPGAPSEDGPEKPLELPDTDGPATDSERREDDLFGGDDEDPEKPPEPTSTRFDTDFDPLAIGGQIYLRLNGSISDRGAFGKQALTMPNLVDVYLDARPEDRVRAFVQGRLRYDPTIADGSRDALGRTQRAATVLLDQLWLKTDIARTVFLTVGKERIKWGSSRLWNPTDFANRQRRDPVVFFDERVGVPMLKVHVPWETFNFYALALLGEANRFDRPAGVLRAEFAFPSVEISASAIAGADRKTTFGLDISAALGPIDVTLEAALIDERDTIRYSGNLDFEELQVPVGQPDGKWRPAISASVLWSANVFDNDLITIGAEYFWNPGGSDRPDLYPWQVLTGSLEPFYLGQHYAALFVLLPNPGDWDRWTFNLSAIGNLSDRSFITRFDAIATLHTRLRLEAFAMGHVGTRGGEFRFALDVPAIPAIPGVLEEPFPGFSLAAPAFSAGCNLRLTL